MLSSAPGSLRCDRACVAVGSSYPLRRVTSEWSESIDSADRYQRPTPCGHPTHLRICSMSPHLERPDSSASLRRARTAIGDGSHRMQISSDPSCGSTLTTGTGRGSRGCRPGRRRRRRPRRGTGAPASRPAPSSERVGPLSEAPGGQDGRGGPAAGHDRHPDPPGGAGEGGEEADEVVPLQRPPRPREERQHGRLAAGEDGQRFTLSSSLTASGTSVCQLGSECVESPGSQFRGSGQADDSPSLQWLSSWARAERE